MAYEDQAQELLNSACTSTLKGKWDKAILAVLLCSGLRREEAADLTFEHNQLRDGRWVIVDLIGETEFAALNSHARMVQDCG